MRICGIKIVGPSPNKKARKKKKPSHRIYTKSNRKCPSATAHKSRRGEWWARSKFLYCRHKLGRNRRIFPGFRTRKQTRPQYNRDVPGKAPGFSPGFPGWGGRALNELLLKRWRHVFAARFKMEDSPGWPLSREDLSKLGSIMRDILCDRAFCRRKETQSNLCNRFVFITDVSNK